MSITLIEISIYTNTEKLGMGGAFSQVSPALERKKGTHNAPLHLVVSENFPRNFCPKKRDPL